MSKEKLYVVEDDNRLHLAFNDAGNPMWFQTGGNFTATDSVASMWSLKHGGHVVTFVEEPEKVVLTKEQAKIVEYAHSGKSPASNIAFSGNNDEELLIDAYVNGYTVAKEKKYNVKVPLVQAQGGLWFYINSEDKLDASYLQELAKKFTIDEIEENGLQDCEKEEVTDDE